MIAIFDSGIGGLPILRKLRHQLPHVSMLYFGDTAYMPYGSRTREEIYERMKWFIQTYDAEVDLYVIACNTATVSLIDDYRQLSRKPFVGIEPGIKPAAEMSTTKQIAVLATPRTTQSAQIPRLIEQFGNGCIFHIIGCDGLAEAIERYPEQTSDRLKACMQQIPTEVDTVVLACTHYLLIKDAIQAAVGTPRTLIDISAAVARRAAALYTALPSHLPSRDASVRFDCSGNKKEFLNRIHTLAPDLF